LLGVLLEEGTRLLRKYGPGVLDKIVEKTIDEGPALVAKGWQKVKSEAPPAATKVRGGGASAGRWVGRQAKAVSLASRISLQTARRGIWGAGGVASRRLRWDGTGAARPTVNHRC
jgi:hypothetical protein